MFSGLSELDAEELIEAVGDEAEIARKEVPEGTLGEPVTIAAIVLLTPMAIGALSLWLSKARRKDVLLQKTRLIHPDGTIEERYLKISSLKEDEAKAETASKIGDWIAETQKNALKAE